uniref:Uncharacterized protein n=1 Tax=Plectus sambesii TaxID=2011161 RepID=A0A914VP13_9BILA
MELHRHLLLHVALLLVVQHSSLAVTDGPEKKASYSDVILHRNVPFDKHIVSGRPQEKKACDDKTQKGCEVERFEMPKESTSYLRHSLASSSRFWGKRTKASEELQHKLITSSRFWGKRSEPTPSTNSIQGIEDFKRKLQSSSPFWGKRSDNETPKAKEMNILKQKLRSSSHFWGKRSGAEQVSAKDDVIKPKSDIQDQLKAYVRLYGKRSGEEADESSDSDTIGLEQKLKASSRFWGKRSAELPDNQDEAAFESPASVSEEEAMREAVLAAGNFWESVRAASGEAARQQLMSTRMFWGKRGDAAVSKSMKQKLKSSSRFWGKRSGEDDDQSELSADDENALQKRGAVQDEQLVTDETNAIKEKLKSSSRFWGKRSLGLPVYLKRKLLNPAYTSVVIKQPPQNANEAGDERDESVGPSYVLDNIKEESEANRAKQQHLQAAPLDGNQLREQSVDQQIARKANEQILRLLDPYYTAEK